MAEIRDLSKLDDQTRQAILKFKDPNASIYPYKKGKTTLCGHKITYDETPGNENIEIRHGKTGSEVFLAPNGDVFVRSPSGDVNINAARHANINVGSNLDVDQKDNSDRLVVNVVGNAHVLVEGDTHFHTKGDRYDLVDGSYTLTVGNRTTIISPDFGIECAGTYVLDGNDVKVDGTSITTNCDVGGEVVFNLFGSFAVNQLLPLAGTVSINTTGNFELNVGQNVNVLVKDRMDIVIAGTGLGALSKSFTLNCVLGGWDIRSSLGTGNLYSTGAMDLDCVTGIYLN